MSKYKNKPIVIDNIKFHSTGEGNRYCQLKLLLRAGKIKDLELQPKFLLQGKFRKDGKNWGAINYIADFKYYDIEQNKTVIEDFKGVKTEAFKIKQKLFENRYQEYSLKIVT